MDFSDGGSTYKFGLSEHIQSFHGELIEDQSGKESDHLDQKRQTFYSV